MKFFSNLLASTLGSLIGGGILLFFFVIIIGALFTPKPSTLDIEDKAILQLNLSDRIGERSDKNPFRSAGLGLPELGGADGLYEIRAALKLAAEDDRISGVYVKLRDINAGWATISALREALLEFKESGKPVYAWSDMWTERSHHLAAVADHIYLHPEGGYELNGFASTPVFLKGMLEKIGVKPRIFKVGEYKSAVEPLTETQMSEANREQVSVLLGDLWTNFSDSLLNARKKIDRATLESAAASAVIMNRPGMAAEIGLIDGLMYEGVVLTMMKEEVYEDKDAELETVTITKYIDSKYKDPLLTPEKGKVAVIFMEGSIVDGKGANGEIGGDKFVREMRKVKKDSSIKAVVLRVNSPGGSALASDLMWAEIEDLKKHKPVIASMGDVAASGGYYISAPCDYIFARPGTITGSIGVFGVLIGTEELTEEKMGLSHDRVVTHEMADLGNPNREMTEAEKDLIQGGVNRTYGRFIDIVRQGRNFPDSISVDRIAQGRVWSGKRALSLGLVDELGGLEDAIAYAKKQADLDDETQIMLLPKPSDPFEMLAQSLSGMKISIEDLSPELQAQLAGFKEVTKWKSGTYALMPLEFDIH